MVTCNRQQLFTKGKKKRIHITAYYKYFLRPEAKNFFFIFSFALRKLFQSFSRFILLVYSFLLHYVCIFFKILIPFRRLLATTTTFVRSNSAETGRKTFAFLKREKLLTGSANKISSLFSRGRRYVHLFLFEWVSWQQCVELIEIKFKILDPIFCMNFKLRGASSDVKFCSFSTFRQLHLRRYT